MFENFSTEQTKETIPSDERALKRVEAEAALLEAHATKETPRSSAFRAAIVAASLFSFIAMNMKGEAYAGWIGSAEKPEAQKNLSKEEVMGIQQNADTAAHELTSELGKLHQSESPKPGTQYNEHGGSSYNLDLLIKELEKTSDQSTALPKNQISEEKIAKSESAGEVSQERVQERMIETALFTLQSKVSIYNEKIQRLEETLANIRTQSLKNSTEKWKLQLEVERDGLLAILKDPSVFIKKVDMEKGTVLFSGTYTVEGRPADTSIKSFEKSIDIVVQIPGK